MGSVRTYRASKKRASKKQAIILIIASGFFIGIIFGVTFSLFLSGQASFAGLENYLHGLTQSRLDTGEVFRDGLFKYGKSVVIIWLLAFAPPVPCLISQTVVMAAKGVGYGFATSTLIGSGCPEAVLIYLPQFFITVPACLLLSGLSVGYSLEIAEAAKTPGLKKYMAVLVIGLCLALAASLADGFLVPLLAAVSV